MQKPNKEALQLPAYEIWQEAREDQVTTKTGVFAVRIASRVTMMAKLGEGGDDKSRATRKNKKGRRIGAGRIFTHPWFPVSAVTSRI